MSSSLPQIRLQVEKPCHHGIGLYAPSFRKNAAQGGHEFISVHADLRGAA